MNTESRKIEEINPEANQSLKEEKLNSTSVKREKEAASVNADENNENAIQAEKNLLANVERFVTRIRMVAQ